MLPAPAPAAATPTARKTSDPARLVAIALVLAVVVVFGPALRYGFTPLDDNDYVTQNPRVLSGPSLENLRWAATTFAVDSWHPLTWVSHMLDVAVWGGTNAAGHRATSVLLHLLSALLLFELLRWIPEPLVAGGDDPARRASLTWTAGYVAMLFAVHPTRLESVVWIAERKEVLSLLLGLCTIFAWGRFVRRGGAGPYLGAVVLYAAGLAAKPTLVSLPFVLVLLDGWPFARIEPWPSSSAAARAWSRRLLRLLAEKAPFFALAVLSSALTLAAQRAGGAVESLEGLPLAPRVANALVSYATYLRQVVWPGELAVVYPRRDSIPAWEVLVAGSVLVLASAAVVRFGRRLPFLVTGWLWFLGTLVPMIGLVQVGVQARADRYTYLSFIGLFVIVAFGMREFVRWRPGSTRAVAAGAVVFIVALSAWTIVQRATWRDGETLFRQALAVTTGSELVHNNYGALLVQQGRPAEAIAQFEAALKVNPRMITARLSLARARLDVGDTRGALDELDRAQQAAPRSAEVRRERGIALARTGRPAEAVESFRAARTLAPGDRRLPADVVRALADAGRRDEAEAELRDALAASPRDPSLLFLQGVFADDAGRAADAVAAFESALSVRPGDVATLNRLGVALARQGRLPEAIARFRRAVEIDPGAAEPRENLRRALAMTGGR